MCCLFLLLQVRTGTKTNVGDALQLPSSQPVFSWFLLLGMAAVTGTALQVLVRGEPGAAEDFLQSLALVHDASSIAAPPLSAWLAGMLVPRDAIMAVVAAYGLATVAPRAEATLGHLTFACAFLLPGLAGEAALMALTPSSVEPYVALGSLPALFGLIGAMLVCHSRNSAVERRARTDREVVMETLHTCVLVGGSIMVSSAWSGVHGGNVGLPAALTVGFVMGAVLGQLMAPRLDVVVEMDLAEGSMSIPDDVPEMVLVIDQTTSLQRIAVAVACGGLGFALCTLVV